MINVHINNTPLTVQSRDKKILQTLSRNRIFDKIYYIGIWEDSLKENENFNDIVSIKRVKNNYFNSSSNNISKFFKLLEWFIRSSKVLKKIQISCVNCHSLPLLPFCVYLKFKKKCKLIYDTHELETETHVSTGLRKRFSKIVENFLIKYVDEISVVSNSMAKWYKKKYSLDKVWVVKNVPISSKPSLHKSNLLREKFKISQDEKVFIYQGVISEGRGIEMLLRVFSNLKNNHIVFMGFGELADKVKIYSENYNNIHFHKPVKQKDLPLYSSSADVGVSLLENSCLNHYYCLPNKIWEYLIGSTPILVCDYPEMKKVIDTFDCGWVVPPIEVEILKAIKELSLDEINNKRKNVQSMHGKFGWEFEEKTLLKMYENLGFHNR